MSMEEIKHMPVTLVDTDIDLNAVIVQARKTRLFDTGATRDTDDNKLDYEGFISPVVLEAYAKYMHECRLKNIPPGQELRSSDNWQKGIPKEQYIKSLIRHVFEAWKQWRTGKTRPIPRHVLCAIMFNVMGYLFEDIKQYGE